MGNTEVIFILAVSTAAIFVFIAGIVLFIHAYRNRLRINEQEKSVRQYKLDLLNNKLMVQQQTMEFIGNEIHDSVAQKLTLAALYSQNLNFQSKVETPESLQQGAIMKLINDALNELRDLSRTLSNYSISDTELHELIRHESQKIISSGICTVETSLNYNKPLPYLIKSSLYRIIQEFVQNSLKHSECNLITICLDDKKGVCLQLRDNGKGFDSNALYPNGLGLNNMKRRARLIGGVCNIMSQPNNGTSLDLYIADIQITL